MQEKHMMKENFLRKLRRKLMRIILPHERQLKKLGSEIEALHKYVINEHELADVGNIGQMLVIHNYTEEEEVFALVVVEVLGMQASLVVDEMTDYAGVGHGLKKYLEARGYHVYYSNEPIARRGKYLAVGVNQVAYLNVIQGENRNKKGTTDVH